MVLRGHKYSILCRVIKPFNLPSRHFLAFVWFLYLYAHTIFCLVKGNNRFLLSQALAQLLCSKYRTFRWQCHWNTSSFLLSTILVQLISPLKISFIDLYFAKVFQNTNTESANSMNSPDRASIEYRAIAMRFFYRSLASTLILRNLFHFYLQSELTTFCIKRCHNFFLLLHSFLPGVKNFKKIPMYYPFRVFFTLFSFPS